MGFDRLNKVHERLSDYQITIDINQLDSQLLNTKQALYVFNLKEKVISYQRNIYELLGYKEDEFTFHDIFSYIHDDDKEVYKRLVASAIDLASNDQISWNNTTFNLTYRIKRSDGIYIKVLRTSRVIETDTKNRMISNLSILTEIDFVNSSDEVTWDLIGVSFDVEKFSKAIRQSMQGFLSYREIQIVQEIKNGLSSKLIADKLNISKYTVDTHRKNIMRKSGVSNSHELIEFATRNGFIA